MTRTWRSGRPRACATPEPDLVRDLGGDVHDQLVVAVVPLGQAGAPLQRQGGDPGAAEGGADGDRGRREDFRQPVVVEHQQVHQAVTAAPLRAGSGASLAVAASMLATAGRGSQSTSTSSVASSAR